MGSRPSCTAFAPWSWRKSSRRRHDRLLLCRCSWSRLCPWALDRNLHLRGGGPPELLPARRVSACCGRGGAGGSGRRLALLPLSLPGG
eukprot:5660678-Pyramimonas_sp.AAC.2